jgi:CheY-like chemotaxis protein
MLNREDLQWITTVSNTLQSLFQQVSHYAASPQQHGMEDNLMRLLHGRIDLASRTAQLLVDSIKSRSGSATRSLKSTIGASDTGPIKVHNPESERELILVVEDDADIADYATDVLLEEGYKVVVAQDGAEAVKVFRQLGQQIGLVILDFFLPTMEGDAVFSEFRALNPNANVLLCSGILSQGFAGQDKLNSMLAQGLRGFLPKPYTRQKLLEQVSCTLLAA